MYFHISISNKSNLPYEVDYVSFKIKHRRTSKRTTIQEVSLKPIRSYSDYQTINSQSNQDNVFVLDQFTLLDKQILLIEVSEKNGIRNQILKVKSSDVLEVQGISEIFLRL